MRAMIRPADKAASSKPKAYPRQSSRAGMLDTKSDWVRDPSLETARIDPVK